MCLPDTLSREAIGIPLLRHAGPVSCVAVSRDCKIVLSGSWDDTVRQWDVSEERTITDHILLLISPDEVRSDQYKRRFIPSVYVRTGSLLYRVH